MRSSRATAHRCSEPAEGSEDHSPGSLRATRPHLSPGTVGPSRRTRTTRPAPVARTSRPARDGPVVRGTPGCARPSDRRGVPRRSDGARSTEAANARWRPGSLRRLRVSPDALDVPWEQLPRYRRGPECEENVAMGTGAHGAGSGSQAPSERGPVARTATTDSDRAARPRIVVIGSLNADVGVTVPEFPAPGATVLGGDLAVSPGGKGANQAVAAAVTGAHVAMVGAVGADPFAEIAVTGLREAGVDLDRVRTVDGATGT